MQNKSWVLLLSLFLVSVISGCWADQIKEGDSSDLKSPSIEGGIEIDPQDTAYRARPEKDRCSSGIMSEMTQCIVNEYKKIAGEVHSSYAQIEKQWNNSEEILQAKQAWSIYQKTKCSPRAMKIIPEGSLYLYSQYACFIHQAKERIEQLEHYLAEDCKTCFLGRVARDIKEISQAEVDTETGRGPYKLVEDRNKLHYDIEPNIYKNPELCKALEKNFNSFLNEPPMICERKFNPGMGFTAPNWKPIASKKTDFELLRQIYYSVNNKRFLSETIGKHWDAYKAKLQTLVDSGETLFWEAEFDIDNDGDTEKVLKKWETECNPNNEEHFSWPPGPSVHVLTSNGSLDTRFSLLDRTAGDVFFYQGTTFLARWREEYNIGYINIYETFKPRNKFGISNKPICVFEYAK